MHEIVTKALSLSTRSAILCFGITYLYYRFCWCGARLRGWSVPDQVAHGVCSPSATGSEQPNIVSYPLAALGPAEPKLGGAEKNLPSN